MHRVFVASAVPQSPRRAVMPVLITMAIGAGYYLAARLSLLLQVQPENIAVFWPAAGLSAGGLLALGRTFRVKVAVAVMLATIAANVGHGASFVVAAAFGACNAIECLLISAMLERLFGAPFQLDSLSRVFGFFGVTLAGTAVAAFPAALTLAYISGVPVPFLTLWQVWIESDALGIVTVAPLLIAIPAASHERLTPARSLEGGILLMLVVATAYVVFTRLPVQASWTTVIPLVLLYPLLLWLAVRCPPIFAAAATFGFALVIVHCVQNGLGALGVPDRPLPERVIFAQAAMLTIAIFALVFSALIANQRSIEAQLRTKEQRLRIASDAARLGVFEWHVRDDRAFWENQRMYEIFGRSALDGPLSFRQFVKDYVDPRDQDRIFGNGANGSESGEVHANCRFRRKDGELRHIEIIGAIEVSNTGEPERLVGVMADVTERHRAEERQSLLIAELDHRVKNALERVASLIASTRVGASSLDDYIDRLTGRIHSMARAHQLLSRERWSGVDLAALVAENLEAYESPGRILAEGPPIKLTADATQALSMVLHELATNAVKYGALSTPSGHVRVSWSREGDRIVLVWTESDGPTVEKPSREGFGSKVIRNPIEYELGGRVRLDYLQQGVRCRLSIPVSRIVSE